MAYRPISPIPRMDSHMGANHDGGSEPLNINEGDGSVVLERRYIPAQGYTGMRSVRLVIYGRPKGYKQTIWISENWKFSDVVNRFTWAPQLLVLQVTWGPKPFWTEADPNTLIANSYHTLYGVIPSENTQHVLGVVRTSHSDYPIAIYLTPETKLLTISQVINESYSDLAGKIKSVTSYSGEREIGNEQADYDELVWLHSSTHSTVLVITIDEPPEVFLSEMPGMAIAPSLQLPLAYCQCLIQQSYNLKSPSLQLAHISRAVLHIVVSLAKELERVLEKEVDDLPDPTAEGNGPRLLHTAPFLPRQLVAILDEINGLTNHLEKHTHDRAQVQAIIDRLFKDVCGEYPGAVTIRRSFKHFQRLGGIDSEEHMYLDAARDPGSKEAVWSHNQRENAMEDGPDLVRQPHMLPQQYPAAQSNISVAPNQPQTMQPPQQGGLSLPQGTTAEVTEGTEELVWPRRPEVEHVDKVFRAFL